MDIDDSSAMCSRYSPINLDMDPWFERQATPVFTGMEVAQSPSQDRRVDTRESIDMVDDREVSDMLAMRSPSCSTSEGSSSTSEGSSSRDVEEVGQMLESGVPAASKVIGMHAISAPTTHQQQPDFSDDRERIEREGTAKIRIVEKSVEKSAPRSRYRVLKRRSNNIAALQSAIITQKTAELESQQNEYAGKIKDVQAAQEKYEADMGGIELMMENLQNEREGLRVEREAHLKKMHDEREGWQEGLRIEREVYLKKMHDEREGWRIEREVHLKKMRDELQAEKNAFEETLRVQKTNEMASYVKRLDVKATKIAESSGGGDRTPKQIHNASHGPPVAEGSRGGDRTPKQIHNASHHGPPVAEGSRGSDCTPKQIHKASHQDSPIAEGSRGGDHTPKQFHKASHQGSPVAEGSRGGDRRRGSDRVESRRESDRVESRRGSDRVEGGRGNDRVSGTPLRRSSSRRTGVPRAPVLVEEESDSDDVVSNHPAQQVKAEAPLPLEDQRIATIVETVMRRLGLGTAPPQQSATKRNLARPRAANNINVETYVKMKPQHLKFLHETRVLFKDTFKVAKDEGFQFYEPPSRYDVGRYEARYPNEDDAPDPDNLAAPDPDNLKYDFDSDAKSIWNRKVSRYLIQALAEQCKEAKLPNVPDEYLEFLITEKFARGRQFYNQAKQRTDDGVVETLKDAENRMVETKGLTMEKARRRERRSKKYSRRIQTLTIIIDEKRTARDKDVALWEWLKDVIERLGKDGMSSDESDTETNVHGIEVPLYRVKILAWRRPMEEELALIDQCRKYATMNWTRGSRPGERRRHPDNAESSRQAVKGLPESLYDAEWLSRRSKQYKEETLLVSKEEFRWLKWMKQGATSAV